MKVRYLIWGFMFCCLFVMFGCDSKNTISEQESSSCLGIMEEKREKAVNTQDVDTTECIYLDEIRNYIGVTSDVDTQSTFSVAIIDSGVFPHEALENRIIAFRDFVYDKSMPYDDSGHGTQIAGIIAGKSETFTGLCPNAKVIGLKVLDVNNKGKTSDIIEALQWVLDNKDLYNIRVVNMSIGFDVISDELVTTCRKVCEEGIIVVSAAGNNTGEIRQGINIENIILVGSVEYDSYRNEVKKASYSNDSDIYTFGTNIYTIDSNTTYKGNIGEKIFNNNNYITVTGTSYSSAIMTGYVCDVLSQEEEESLDCIMEMLFQTDLFIFDEKNNKFPVLKRRNN